MVDGWDENKEYPHKKSTATVRERNLYWYHYDYVRAQEYGKKTIQQQ